VIRNPFRFSITCGKAQRALIDKRYQDAKQLMDQIPEEEIPEHYYEPMHLLKAQAEYHNGNYVQAKRHTNIILNNIRRDEASWEKAAEFRDLVLEYDAAIDAKRI
jgi:hypothetical protein